MTQSVGVWLSSLVRRFDPHATEEKIINLEFDGDDPFTFVVISALNYIWEAWSKMKKATIEECKMNISSLICYLYETKHQNIAEIALLHIAL